MFVTYERGRILTKFVVIWLVCRVVAVDASGASNDFASLEKRYKKDAGKELQTILPVQVDFGGFVNGINLRISGMEGDITDLGEQLRIIEEKDAKLQEEALQLKSRLNSCKESKAEEVANLKEEISRLKEQLKSPDDKECCLSSDCSDYRGRIAKTVSGKDCQAWSSEKPHKKKKALKSKMDSGELPMLTENFCRNPNGHKTTWCYTVDPDTRWENCNIHRCSGPNGNEKWRNDLRCGAKFLINGKPAECDPEGEFPCCSPRSWCGKTKHHCQCSTCINYAKTNPEKYIFIKEKKTWTAANDHCQSIGAKLAEPDTMIAVDYLGGTTDLKDGGPFWLGGSCNGCSHVADDRWYWVSGKHLSLNYPAWRKFNGRQMPGEGSRVYDATSLTLLKDERTGYQPTFVNYGGSHSFPFICQLP